MSIDAHLKDLVENFDEILGSTEALKGEDFVTAVMAHFDASQIVEIISALVSIADDEHKEFAEALAKMGLHVLTSLVAKASGDLEPEQLKEARKMGDSLIARRDQLKAVLKKELGSDD